MFICETYPSCTIPIHVHVVLLINVTSHLDNKLKYSSLIKLLCNYIFKNS